MRMRTGWVLGTVAVALAAVWAWAPVGAVAQADEDAERLARQAAHREFLLDGVEAIGVGGIPGPLVLLGPDAFPVVNGRVARRPACIVGAVEVGDGRAVAFPHGAYLGARVLGSHDSARLMRNACLWAMGADNEMDDPKPIGCVGHGPVAGVLREAGITVRGLGGDWADHLDELSAIVVDTHALRPDQREALDDFLQDGGGLITSNLAWGWMQLNPGRSLTGDHGGNLLLAPYGLAWGDGYMEVPGNGRVPVAAPGDVTLLTHAGRALTALRAEAAGERTLADAARATAVANLSRAVNALPPDDPHLLPRLEAALQDADVDRVPRPGRALTDGQGLGKVLLAMEIRRARAADPRDVQAHPAHRHFPGPVPDDAETVTRTVEVDPATPGWHSTGLYAPAGAVIRARIPDDAAGTGLRLRIGCHKDVLWDKGAWRRAPEITRSTPMTERATALASAFGGLVYVEAPGRAGDPVDVRISGAVPAPHFVLGETDPDEWRETIRHNPGPWAELETDKVIISVPSADVRDLDDPAALMTWWNTMMDACADLAARPRERRRPERYVADEQISAGYMHAGYPIMTHLDAGPRFVDLEHLSTEGDWGMFHEMGHNHQHPDWTFGGTGEVTCNLFSLYVMETCCSDPDVLKPARLEQTRRRKASHLEAGAPFDQWKAEPFLALIMYQELQRAFGWEAYKKVFAEYRDLKPGERPRNDQQKRDQWMVRMSRTVGRDLGPFFQSWGIPVTDAALREIEDLPEWMPED